MDGGSEMRAHIVADVNAGVSLIGDSALVHEMCALSYPDVDAAAGTDEEAPSVLWPKDAIFETLIVDRSAQTLLWCGSKNIPERLRGSFPCFNLKLPPDTVVHGFFYRSSNALADTSSNSIKLALFDISQSNGDDFTMLDPEQRQRRLWFLFTQWWHEQQNKALLRLCKRLQTMSEAEKQLGQDVMDQGNEIDDQWVWSVEFLNAFSRYEWRGGSYHAIVQGMNEMASVIHPIPEHIQLFQCMPTERLKSMRENVQASLPGAPAFGCILQLPPLLAEGNVCKLVQM